MIQYKMENMCVAVGVTVAEFEVSVWTFKGLASNSNMSCYRIMGKLHISLLLAFVTALLWLFLIACLKHGDWCWLLCVQACLMFTPKDRACLTAATSTQSTASSSWRLSTLLCSRSTPSKGSLRTFSTEWRWAAWDWMHARAPSGEATSCPTSTTGWQRLKGMEMWAVSHGERKKMMGWLGCQVYHCGVVSSVMFSHPVHYTLTHSFTS